MVKRLSAEIQANRQISRVAFCQRASQIGEYINDQPAFCGPVVTVAIVPVPVPFSASRTTVGF